MKKRIFSWMIASIVAVAMTLGGGMAAFAGEASGESPGDRMAATGFGAAATSPQADSADGKDVGGLMWSFSPSSSATGVVPGKYVSPPTLSGDYVYVSSEKTLYQIDKATGRLNKSVDLKASSAYSLHAPVVGDGKIFITEDGANVAIVDEATMKLVATVNYASGETNHQGVAPIVYDEASNSIFTGSWTGKTGVGGTYARIELDKIDDADQGVTVLATEASNNGFYWAGACVNGSKVVFGSDAAADGKSKLFVYDMQAADGSDPLKTLDFDASIRSTVLYDQTTQAYYVTTYDGKLHKVMLDANGNPTVEKSIDLPGGKSICTPVAYGGQLYVGSNGSISVIDPNSMTISKSMAVPGNVPSITIGDETHVYCTYNDAVGGIFNAAAGTDYFIPDPAMQQYSISSIVKDGDILYYKNDSGNLMAVKPAYSIEGADITWNSQQFTYNGKAQRPTGIQVTWNGQKLVSGTDYRIRYEDNVDAGTGKVVVTGIGEYARTVSKAFAIEPASIAKASVKLSKSSYVYNGKARKPSIVVKLAGKKLSARAYRVTYSGGSKNVGAHKVTVKGIGNYKGTASKHPKFTILPQATTISGLTAGEKSLTVKWKKKTKQTKGYQIRYGTKKNLKGGTNVTVRKNKTTSRTIAKLQEKKKYYVRVRTYQKTGGKRCYSAWSKTRSVKTK